MNRQAWKSEANSREINFVFVWFNWWKRSSRNSCEYISDPISLQFEKLVGVIDSKNDLKAELKLFIVQLKPIKNTCFCSRNMHTKRFHWKTAISTERFYLLAVSTRLQLFISFTSYFRIEYSVSQTLFPGNFSSTLSLNLEIYDSPWVAEVFSRLTKVDNSIGIKRLKLSEFCKRNGFRLKLVRT